MIWSGTSFFFPHGLLIASPHLYHPELWSHSFFLCPATKARKLITSYIHPHLWSLYCCGSGPLQFSLLDCSRQPLSLLISPCCRKNCISTVSCWSGSPLFQHEISLVWHTRSFRIWTPTNYWPLYLSSLCSAACSPMTTTSIQLILVSALLHLLCLFPEGTAPLVFLEN